MNEELELPQGWEVATVGDCCDVLGGKRLPKGFELTEENTGHPYIRVTNFFDFSVLQEKLKYVPKKAHPNIERYIIKSDDVYISIAGTIGLVGQVPDNLSGSNLTENAARIVIQNGLVSKFLMYQLASENLQEQIRQKSIATTQSKLGLFRIKELEILLPPLEEQKRIAGKLETLLAQVDIGLEHLNRVPGILKRFRQAVLAAATSGELTEDWRIENDFDKNSWRTLLFQDVCREITVGFVGKMADQYIEEGIHFLRSQNVRPFRFDPKNLLYVSKEFHYSISKSKLSPGDVVVVRSGAPGQCCVIPREIQEANCSDLVIVRPGQELLSEYACIFINESQSQAFVRSEVVGVAQAHFNVGSMKITPLNLPSLEEQAEIVKRVEGLFALAASLQTRYEAALKQFEKLTPALLAKAFRGELVPQDPNDEPAAVLLERIAASKQESTKIKSEKAGCEKVKRVKKPRNTNTEQGILFGSILVNSDGENAVKQLAEIELPGLV
jgi:type I restriction enzyme, S subunit